MANIAERLIQVRLRTEKAKINLMDGKNPCDLHKAIGVICEGLSILTEIVNELAKTPETEQCAPKHDIYCTFGGGQHGES